MKLGLEVKILSWMLILNTEISLETRIFWEIGILYSSLKKNFTAKNSPDV
jgi:hypothetical protein